MYNNKTVIMMKKIFALFILIIFTPMLSAQNTGGAETDSLFNTYMNMRTPQHAGRYPLIESVDTTHVKCGFGIISSVLENYNNFTPAQKKILKPLLDRPVTDTSVVTPNGFFRIHYDLTGPNAPTYSIDSLEVILDSVYNFEINYLGYPPPPPDNGMGGDNKYDVYIQSLGNTYGFTQPENPTAPGSQTYTSYLTLDNDYTGFYTTG